LSQAQSGYLDVWIQLGLAGVVCLLVMIGQAALNVMRAFKNSAHPAFVRWCIVVIVCNLIYNIGESDYCLLRILWFLFVIANLGLRKEALSVPAASVELRSPSSVKSRRTFLYDAEVQSIG
jgi:O-antigen ligase